MINAENINIDFNPSLKKDTSGRIVDIEKYIQMLTERIKFCFDNINDENYDYGKEIQELRDMIIAASGSDGVGQFTNEAHTAEIFNDYPSDDNIGNIAEGDYSTARGKSTFAYGDNSFAAGCESHAGEVDEETGERKGKNAIALGRQAKALADNTVAIGDQSEATGKRSVAVAGGNASGEESVAIGFGSASQFRSFAAMLGARVLHPDENEKDVKNTIHGAAAIGYDARAYHESSVAIGEKAEACAARSMAVGWKTMAVNNNQFVCGYKNKPNFKLSTDTKVSSSKPYFIKKVYSGQASYHPVFPHTLSNPAELGLYESADDNVFVVGANGNILELDKNGNLTVKGNIFADGKKIEPVTIATLITAQSLNTEAAGVKAVFDFVTEAISGITTVKLKKVATLPDVGEANVIYLVPKPEAKQDDIYDEWIYIAEGWERIGSTEIDLSDYVKTEDLSSVAFSGNYNDLSNKPTIPTVPTKLSEFTDDLGNSPTHTHSQYLTEHQDISGKVDKTTKVNGKALSSDINLSASDVGALPDSTQLLQLGEVTGTAYDGGKGKSVRDDLNTHIADNVRHITADERTAWNAKQNAITESSKLPYALVSGTPTIPAVNNGTLTVKHNNAVKGTFSANQSANTDIDIVTALPSDISAVNSRIDNLVITQGGDSPTEVMDARTGYDGTIYTTLKTRIDTEVSGLAESITEIYNSKKYVADAGQYKFSYNLTSGKTYVFSNNNSSGAFTMTTTDNGVDVENIGTLNGGEKMDFVPSSNAAGIRGYANAPMNMYVYEKGTIVEVLETEVDGIKNPKVTEFIEFEVGGIADADGVSPLPRNDRIRTVSPIKFNDIVSVTPPTGYSLWVFMLDSNKMLLGTFGAWKDSVTSDEITGRYSNAKFVNLVIKKGNGSASLINDVEIVTENTVVGMESTFDYFYKRTNELDERVTRLENGEVKLPAYSQTMVDEINNKLSQLQNSKSSSVVFMTDIHIAGATDSDETLHAFGVSSKAIDSIAKECNIDFLMLNGDYIYNTQSQTKEATVEWYNALSKYTRKIEVPKFIGKGNHDVNDIARTTVNALTDEELYKFYLKDTNLEYVGNYGEIEKAYGYFDITNRKIRCIFINTVDNPYIVNGTSITLPQQYISAVKNNQVNFIAKALKFTESGWGVVFFSHHALQNGAGINPSGKATEYIDTTRGGEQLLEVINAYRNKVAYKNTAYSGGEQYNIDVDFSDNASSEVIAMISGHSHADRTDVVNGIRMISTMASSFVYTSYDESGNIVSRTAKTSTETSWDILTIDRASRKIYATRYGAGSDREFAY